MPSVFPVLLVLLACLRGVWSFTSGNETLLRTALFTTNAYDKDVRPAEPTLVSLKLVPISLNSIDIKAQTMSISGWWDMAWSDSRLTWTASSYDGITETHASEDKVWTPVIVVYNSVDDMSAIDEDSIPVRVLNTGQLMWSPPGIITASCSTDITYFPFDTQTCGISVKTFGYTKTEMLLEAHGDEFDFSYYSANGEWDLIGYWTTGYNYSDFSFVTFNFQFKRKPDFYGLNLILPVILMAVLSLFSFLMPVESGEKMGYCFTVMLTFVVLVTIVSDLMPTTADHTSALEVFLNLVMVFSTLSVVFNILALYLYFKKESESIPPMLVTLTKLAKRLMCYGVENCSDKVDIKLFTPRQPTSVKPDGVEHDNGHADELKQNTWHLETEAEVTWQEMSRVLDAFMFRVYIVINTLMILIFLPAVAAN